MNDLLSPARLREEFERRKAIDPKYSLRKFAKDLDLSKSALASYIAGKRGLMPATAKRVAAALGLPPEDIEKISKTLHRRRKWDSFSSYTDVTPALFGILEDEICLGLLSLARIENRADENWLARRLRTSPERIVRAIGLLKDLELIRIDGGRLKRTSPLLDYPTQQPSKVIRNYHRSVIGRALKSLDEDAYDLREFAAVTVPMNTRHMAEAKKMMHRFKKRLATYVNRGAASEVYILSLQLFPLSHSEVTVG